MFERYTERARRVIFFARYEASQFGSMTIESEHLLMGLVREDHNLPKRFVDPLGSRDDIRKLIEERLIRREKVSTALDLPLAEDCKRILAYSAEEAERLNHRHIGTEHLLLGILREDKCGATQVLKEAGFDLGNVREQMVRSTEQSKRGDDVEGRQHLQAFLAAEFPSDPTDPPTIIVPDEETAQRVAEAAWTLHFDAAAVESQKPLNVEQRFSVWIVWGTAPVETALFAFISRKTGKILAVGRGEPTGT